MPTITDTPVKAYAHCRDARCPGYNQQEVDALRQESALTYGELGGDGVFMNFVERSTVKWLFVRDDEGFAPDEACPGCGQSREVTGSPRPSYQPISGHDPLGLIGGPKFNPSVVNTEQDAAMAEMRAEMNRMKADMDAMRREPED